MVGNKAVETVFKALKGSREPKRGQDVLSTGIVKLLTHWGWGRMQKSGLLQAGCPEYKNVAVAGGWLWVVLYGPMMSDHPRVRMGRMASSD